MKLICRRSAIDSDMIELFTNTNFGGRPRTLLWAVVHEDFLEDFNIREDNGFNEKGDLVLEVTRAA